MNYSFWEKYFIESASDITILGSGIVGLSTAISIKEMRPDLSVKMLERGTLPSGASTKNAGFSCFGSVSELLDDIASMGIENCMEVVGMRLKGLSKLKSRVGEITMEYQNCGGIELFRSKDQVLKDACFSQLKLCNQMMADYHNISNCYQMKENIQLSSFDRNSIYNAHEGTINPMSMILSLIQKAQSLGVNIIHGIDIDGLDLSNKVLHSNNGLQISYLNLVICTNGFASKLLPELNVIPARNQVLITRPVSNNPLSSGYHMDKGYIYFRNYQGRILLGGGRNIDPEGEITAEFGNSPVIKDYLVTILESIFPGGSNLIEHWWSGILGLGPSKFPIIKWHDENVLIGVRLGGMGVAIGSYLGDQLAKEVIEKN